MGGVSHEALADFTGAPVHSFRNDISQGHSEEHWLNILDAERNDFIMCCGTSNFLGGRGDSYSSRIGLAQGHEYSLLGAYEISPRGIVRGEDSKPDSRNTRLLKLRNPWGNEKEWKGAFSDNSRQLTEQIKKGLKYDSKGNDGTFFIEYADWLKYFEHYSICYFHDDFIHSGFKLKSSPDTPSIFEFRLK